MLILIACWFTGECRDMLQVSPAAASPPRISRLKANSARLCRAVALDRFDDARDHHPLTKLTCSCNNHLPPGPFCKFSTRPNFAKLSVLPQLSSEADRGEMKQ